MKTEIQTFREFLGVKSRHEVLSEISSEPVHIEWYYKKSGDWYGSFYVNDIEYDIAFKNEGRNIGTNKNIGSLKFSRPDISDTHSFAKDFNKPLVVANTILESLKEYIQEEKIDVFVFKSYKDEKSRVTKYRKLAKGLVFGNFSFSNEIQEGKYVYFILYKNSYAFKNTEILQFINRRFKMKTEIKKFSEFVQESLLDKVKKELTPMIKELPEDFEYEIDINGITIKNAKGQIRGKIDSNTIKKNKVQEVIKKAYDLEKMKAPEQTVMDLGKIDWAKHYDI
jgi:hypothetical protein